jgi:hypothetical protein
MRKQDHIADRMLVRQQHHHRSMPMPMPAAGGMPYESARM